MIVLRLFLFLSLVLPLPLLFKRDFRLPPIHAWLPKNPHWEMPPPNGEILEILKGPFTYYTKGNQTLVFESRDKNYVLKLFRYKRSIFPLMHVLKNFYKKNPRVDFEAKAKKTFNAAYIACNEGAEFTGALYCRLNASKDVLPVAQLEVDGKNYNLPLDLHRFVLQKKGVTLKEALFSARNDPEKMHQLIESFLDLLIRRTSQNIQNSDPNLGLNFGFLGTRAIEIDFGNYQKVSPDPRRQKGEILFFLKHLECWIAKRMPEHANFITELRRNIEINYNPTE